MSKIKWHDPPDKCVICGRLPPIDNSHIIPKFVFRWMTKTAPTPYLRHGDEPNKRLQDGTKYPLLCTECETLASKYEKSFAERVFNPSIRNGSLPKRVGKSEYLFASGIHLRVQEYLVREGSFTLKKEQENMILGCIKKIAAYHRGDRASATDCKFFLLPLGLGSVTDHKNLPSNWHRYIERSTEFDLIESDKGHTFGSYFKIGPWVSFCLIKNRGQPWIGCEILPTSTKFANRNSIIPPMIIGYLADRARYSQKVAKGLSPRQQEIVDNSILQNAAAAVETTYFRSLEKDWEAFGPRIWED